MSTEPRVRIVYEGATKVVYGIGPITVRVGKDGVYLCLTCGYPKHLTCAHVDEVRAWAEQQQQSTNAAA